MQKLGRFDFKRSVCLCIKVDVLKEMLFYIFKVVDEVAEAPREVDVADLEPGPSLSSSQCYKGKCYHGDTVLCLFCFCSF